MSQPTLTLHGLRLSGHSHRAELFLSLLGRPYRFVESPGDVRASEPFRRLNPLGQIPVLVDGDVVIADSNAILVYLARRYAPGSDWLPDAAETAAQVQRWLSIAAGEIRFGPALARLMILFRAQADRGTVEATAARILSFMEAHLGRRAFLAAAHPTIADIACYSYVAHAPEGGVSLEPYPAIRAWLGRIEALPGFVPMPRSPLPTAA
ncbi:glutathione S-transferase [Methylobacterium sp. BE186]|uniref:glutathione S-transferase family protein n=1 Tax=Methylobacterium sp. BE186 TaxID=2817715 RepID=UPI0028648B05|nr:glutathione S-transferase [Methylobacterium sp. BE186]MDR7036314.1 glutathione S-transferase [Methylobacterium sp. BE186]